MKMKAGKFNIKSALLKQPGFWFFQVTGWLFLAVAMKLYFPDREVFTLLKFYEFFNFYFIGFLLTSGLRLVYKRILRKGVPILLIVAASIISSAILMLLLSLFDGLANYPFWDDTMRDKFIKTWQYFNPAHFYHDNLFWFVLLMLWSVLYFGIKAWIDLRETKEKSDKALLLVQRSQLQLLRYQLNPHFLFNSLNSIQALIYEDPECADRMLIKLSEFLRYTLRNQDKLLIPLSEEVKIVEEYLSLEHTRFPDRLKYSVNVTDEAAEKEVVAFILQPFIENAIKHGMKSSPDFLEITVNAAINNGKLTIEIKNNGEWIDSDEEGVGIKNVFERLQNAFPGQYSLNILNEKGFVSVYITIDQQKTPSYKEA
ncbi:MAG: histidine kinase [Bacteroidales bacterium]